MASYTFFLINLDRSPERLAHMRKQAEELKITLRRVPGVDGSANLPEWLRQGAFDSEAGLSSGEIGCYASHLSVCRQIREQSLDAAIVLEDDVTLAPDFEVASTSAIQSAPSGWDIIHFSTHFKRPAFPIAPLGNGRALVRYARMPSNSAAYAISSAGASKLLAAERRGRPYDLEFRYAWLRGLEVYGVYPPLACQHNASDSTIEAEWRGRGADGSRQRGKSPTQRRWKPSLASQVKGLFFVAHRLGPSGMLYCWSHELPNAPADRQTAKALRSPAPPPAGNGASCMENI